jgi:hypothetical protein
MFSRLIVIVVLATALISSVAKSQFMTHLFLSTATSAAYTGEGDLGAWSGFWSCTFAFSRSFANSLGNACDIQRASDNTVCTISAAATGLIDVSVGTPCASSTTLTSWCNATTCSVKKLYEQSGAASPHSPAQATLANMPVLKLGCLNTTLPCMEVTGSTQTMTAGSYTPSTGLQSYYIVMNRTSGTAVVNALFPNSTQGVRTAASGFFATRGNAGGTCSATAGGSAWHIMTATVALTGVGTNPINIDGTNGSACSTVTGGTTTGTFEVMAGTGASTVDFMEMGFIDAGALLANTCHNANQRYGLGKSC